jgi:hypothetical protein
MKITSSSQVVDLEEEDPKGKTCMEMVEATTKNEETNTESRPQKESNTKVFSNRKYIFGLDTWGSVSVQGRFDKSVCYERKYGE